LTKSPAQHHSAYVPRVAPYNQRRNAKAPRGSRSARRGEGRERHPTGGGSSTLSPGGHAIEGTSCGLGAKLEGAAIGAYAEKYRFVPGCSLGPWRIGKTPWRASQNSRRAGAATALRPCKGHPRLGDCRRATLAMAAGVDPNPRAAIWGEVGLGALPPLRWDRSPTLNRPNRQRRAVARGYPAGCRFPQRGVGRQRLILPTGGETPPMRMAAQHHTA